MPKLVETKSKAASVKTRGFFAFETGTVDYQLNLLTSKVIV